ncbi:MAG: FAD-dependent oxidoreductase, partial [Candidatus Korobacteraceae bacterium]
MKTWDVVIIGGGVIGLSLAWRLRRDGASVLIVEKSEPAREATHAAGGMIAHCDPHNPPALASLIAASARMYPEFVRELREESFESPDLRTSGTIAFFEENDLPGCDAARAITDEELVRMEPLVTLRGRS